MRRFIWRAGSGTSPSCPLDQLPEYRRGRATRHKELSSDEVSRAWTETYPGESSRTRSVAENRPQNDPGAGSRRFTVCT